MVCNRFAAAAAKSLQSCPTLCDPRDSSPPGFPIPGILQAKYWSGLPFPSPVIGLKRAYLKTNYRLYIYFYRAITPIKYLLLLISSINICYLPSHFIYLLYLPQFSDFKNRSHRMGKGYQWKRICLFPGKTKLNKTFEHSS